MKQFNPESKSEFWHGASNLFMQIFRIISIVLIRVHQVTLSQDHGLASAFGPRCRFYPSCSQYTKETIKTYGAVRGWWLGLKRVLRCHPWNPGGYDPIKIKKSPNHSAAAGAMGQASRQKHTVGSGQAKLKIQNY